MAFENVFGNVDFRMLPAAKQQQQQTFLTMLGRGIEQGQRAREFDLRKRQLEYEMSKPPEFDLTQAGQTALVKERMGMELTPQEVAAKDVFLSAQTPKMGLNEFGQLVPMGTPYQSFMSGGRAGAPAMAPSPGMALPGAGAPTNYVDDIGVTDPQAAQRAAAIAAQSDVSQVEPILKEDLPMEGAVAAPDGSVLPEPQYTRFPKAQIDERVARTPFGVKLSTEQEAEVAKSERDLYGKKQLEKYKADIQFRKEQLKTEKGRDKVVGTIQETMSSLEELNDRLKAKEAIITNDSNFLDALKNKYGTSWLGRQTSSVTKPEIESLRQEYTLKRDSIIPSYVAYFDLPATMVDTEEFAQRVLQSFGDPAMNYEANRAALKNMRQQFGMQERAAPSKKRLKYNPQTGALE